METQALLQKETWEIRVVWGNACSQQLNDFFIVRCTIHSLWIQYIVSPGTVKLVLYVRRIFEDVKTGVPKGNISSSIPVRRQVEESPEAGFSGTIVQIWFY